MGIMKDISYVIASNIVTIVVSLLYYPLLVNLYSFSSEVFGGFQYVFSVIGVIASFCLIAMDTAYVSENKAHTPEEQTKFITWLLLIGVSIKLLAVFSWALVTRDASFALMGTIIGIPQVFWVTVQTMLRDKKRFKLLSGAIIVQSVSNVVVGTIVGYFLRSAITLVIAIAISYVVTSSYIIMKGKICFRLAKLDHIYLSLFIRNNRNLIVFQTSSSTLNALSFNLPVFMLKILFGDYVLGLYSLAYRLILSVNKILSQALTNTFLPYFGKSREDEKKLYEWLPYLALGLYPVYLIISLLSDWYIPILFTNSFRETSNIIKILIPWQFTVAIVNPYSSSILVHRRADISLWLNVLLILARVVVLSFGVIFNYKIVLFAFSVVSTLIFDLILIFSCKYAGVRVRKSILILFLTQVSLCFPLIESSLRWASLFPFMTLIWFLLKERGKVKELFTKMKKLI